MARSHGHRNHIIKTKEGTGELAQNGDGTTGPERAKFTAWCGEVTSGHKNSYGGFTMPPGWTDYETAFRPCPKCQSKMLATKLKETPISYVLGERVDGSDSSNPYGVPKWGYKSVYPVIDMNILAEEVRDTVVGFVCVETGWGKLWRVHIWEGQTLASSKEAKEPTMGGVVEYQKPISRDSDKTWAQKADGYSSKEEALMMFPTLAEQSLLRTRATIKERDRLWLKSAADREAERERQREADEVEREQRRAERENKRAALLADIRNALDFGLPVLSNFQRDVFIRTAKAAGFSDEELTAPLAAVTAEPETDEWGQVIA